MWSVLVPGTCQQYIIVDVYSFGFVKISCAPVDGYTKQNKIIMVVCSVMINTKKFENICKSDMFNKRCSKSHTKTKICIELYTYLFLHVISFFPTSQRSMFAIFSFQNIFIKDKIQVSHICNNSNSLFFYSQK